MSLKDKLVKELGEAKAAEILSAQGKEMRAKVKHPYYHFNSETASAAAKLGWKQRHAKSKPKSQETPDPN